MEFVNPRPMSRNSDFRNNPAYSQGAVVEIVWTAGDSTDNPVSLTLWQANATTADFFGSMEYITQNVVNKTSFSWIVATTKDLAESNVFFLSLFEEGQRLADTDSQFFNITGNSRDQPPDLISSITSISTVPQTGSPSASVSPSASASGSSTSLAPILSTPTGVHSAPASDATETRAPGSSHSASASPPSTQIGTSARIGIGVGVASAVILGLVAGWVLFGRRRRRRRDQTPTAPTAHYDPYAQGWNEPDWREQAPMGQRGYDPNYTLAPTSTGQAHGMQPGREKHAMNQQQPVEMGSGETTLPELSGMRD